jgi:catechol 2,3-dioxygenase-like lactoylglutathione lyase family enzyme
MSSEQAQLRLHVEGAHRGRPIREEAMGNQDVGARITQVSAVAIPVSDQDRALEFYTQVLGFEKRLDAPFGGGRWISVAPPGGTAEIALVAGDERTAARAHTGIRLTTPDADALHAHLRDRGVDTDPEVSRMGEYVPAMFSFRDPDGNELVIVELR